MGVYTVTSDKGGVGKSTTAVHIAAYLSRLAPTLLVDGDAIKTALKWSRKGNGGGLPFKVVTHAQMVSHIRDHTHVVIDTEGNPSADELKDLAESCDLLIIPAIPEGPANDGLIRNACTAQRPAARQISCVADQGAAEAEARRGAATRRAGSGRGSDLSRRNPAVDGL